MVILNDLKWPILSYYVIYYEKIRKKSGIEQSSSFNMHSHTIVFWAMWQLGEPISGTDHIE